MATYLEAVEICESMVEGGSQSGNYRVAVDACLMRLTMWILAPSPAASESRVCACRFGKLALTQEAGVTVILRALLHIAISLHSTCFASPEEAFQRLYYK